MLFYIDYLDHITSGSYDFENLSLRLRFDLLIYGGNDTLCMSVPSCVKIGNTTKLLMELGPFWKEKKIKLQLDKRHNGKASNYFNNRKSVLAKGMTEERLINHFEFIAYENPRTKFFYDVYLPEIVNASSSDLFIDKVNDTDALFRAETVNMFERHYDLICQSLDVERSIIFTGITNKIAFFAIDQSSLFQRALIEESIVKEFHPHAKEQRIISTLLDRSFALANAYTSNAIPLSLVLNQLTGKWLIRLLSKSYPVLYSTICKITWEEVFYLSQDIDWKNFINYINAYIYIEQQFAIRKEILNIECIIHKLINSISLFSLLRIAKREALDAAKNKLFESGLLSEAQNLDLMADLLTETYAGRYRRLFDIISAIDLAATRIEEKLKKDKKYAYLLDLGIKQQKIGFELRK